MSAIFFFQSCKKQDSKQDYIEITKEKSGTTTKATYKKRRLITSEVFNESGKLDSKYIYNKGTVIKMYQYFPDQKVSSYSYLNKAPNHFTTTIYFRNGKIACEGEGDYFKSKNLYLRRGPWIFYTKSGKPYSIYTFSHDKKKEYIKGEMLFDTIKKKITKDVIYDPPFLYGKKILIL